MATYIVYNDPNKLKIGATRKTKDIKKSLKKRYQTALGSDVKILIFRCDYPFVMEKKVHNKFAPYRDSLEIFNVNIIDAINFMHTLQANLQKYHIDILEKMPQRILQLIAEDNGTPPEIICKTESHILFNKITAKTYKVIAKHLQIKAKTKVEIMDILLVKKSTAKKTAIAIFKPIIFYYHNLYFRQYDVINWTPVILQNYATIWNLSKVIKTIGDVFSRIN